MTCGWPRAPGGSLWLKSHQNIIHRCNWTCRNLLSFHLYLGSNIFAIPLWHCAIWGSVSAIRWMSQPHAASQRVNLLLITSRIVQGRLLRPLRSSRTIETICKYIFFVQWICAGSLGYFLHFFKEFVSADWATYKWISCSFSEVLGMHIRK